jgi:glutaredoxin-like protein NrdH
VSNRVIRLYGKENCVQCNASERKLDEYKLEFVHEDATTDESMTIIKSLDKDYMRAPVMSVEVDGVVVDHWTGYRPDKTQALVA